MKRIITFALAIGLFGAAPSLSRAGKVSGRVEMPDVCSPSVSPAVVVLSPAEGTVLPDVRRDPVDVALVNQRGLQFVPRVQTIVLGQTLRFTNDDAETHNVHVVSPGGQFNETMAPGQPRDFTPDRAGVVRLACDIHAHMRGYVVVSPTPWARVCSVDGRYDLGNLSPGRYTLTAWHEMGDPVKKLITVEPGKDLVVEPIVLDAARVLAPSNAATAQVRSWPDVIDRIGVVLSASLDAVRRPDGFRKARTLAQDSYFVEFEGSQMETAVRLHFGFARAYALERKFRGLVPALREVAEQRRPATHASDLVRDLMIALVEASRDLNSKGVIDAAHLQVRSDNDVVLEPPPAPSGDRSAQVAALRAGFDRVREMADQGDGDEASARMAALYFEEFEAVERSIQSRRPQDIRPLEEAYNAVRGEVASGALQGQALAARLNSLQSDVEAALDRVQGQPLGSFGPAFGASFVTALREGAEVILLLAMLVALAVKTGQTGAIRAIAWGVGLAVLASAATAVGLNFLVASARGRAREVMEGGVMLAASAVLFYVSYWLISQSESKRWMSFLKRQATSASGSAAMLVTAFLAVYREGAETALMYQAMIGSQGGSRAGLSGLAVGLVAGVVILAAVALLIRASSLRIPLRAFFQVTGVVLFLMAAVFAGNGVFALQESGFVRITPLSWLGSGLPVLGVHPSLQALSVQALLLAGALLALVVMAIGTGDETTRPHTPSGTKKTIGVGV